MSLQEATIEIKRLFGDTIITGGTEARINLIRSSAPINQIHEAVKQELIDHGVNPELIRPLQGQSHGELALYGFLKKKAQDICVISQLAHPVRETVVLDKIDPFGVNFTKQTLSINVRSQLSSSAKNFDTLYERTFAEALNLHERCPEMVLGEVYMIAVREYDTSASHINEVRFAPLDNNIKNHVEKYIKYFDLLNNRSNAQIDKHKYERVALLLVDFSQPTPKIYETNAELYRDGLLDPSSTANIENLTFSSFVGELLRIHEERFGANHFN